MPAMLRQVLPHGVMLAVSVFLYWSASTIDASTGGRIGPDVWPKAIIVFMGLLCAYEIARRILAARRGEAEAAAPAATPASAEPAPPERAHPMLYRGIAVIAAYLVVVPWLGFTVATLLFLFAFQVAGGLARPGLAAVVAGAGTASLAVMFLKVAYISLPLGVGPFQAISIGVLRLLGV